MPRLPVALSTEMSENRTFPSWPNGFVYDGDDLHRKLVRIFGPCPGSRVTQGLRAHRGLANIHIDQIDLLNDRQWCSCRG